MKSTAIAAPAPRNALALNPLAGLACTGLAVVVALLCASPGTMVQNWAVDLLLALGVEAPAVWLLVLDAPNFWHVAVFAALTLGLLVTVPGRPHLCVRLAMLLGVFLELVQVFVPSREAGVIDLVYNLAGVSAAFFGFMACKRIARGFKTVLHQPLARHRQTMPSYPTTRFARDTEKEGQEVVKWLGFKVLRF